MTHHTGRWMLEDRFSAPWHYLPVEVPGFYVCALRVELEYERSGAVMDLGCFGPAGFRGWSGGARRTFVITSDTATPGYLSGELEPGTWHVVIGLHRVPPGGAEYTLTAQTLDLAGRARARPGAREYAAALRPARPAPARLAPPGRRWLAGDLHTHTVHSDGAMTVPELARFAAGRGLDFLAVTDHNTISHHAELAPAAAAHGIALIPGQEVTTEAGHANALGNLNWIDFREPADAWLEATEQAGGLLSVNHPIGGQVSWAAPMKRRPPLIEIWHWSWLDTRWTTPLGWWLAWDPGRHPGGRQRLAPAGIGRAARLADDLGSGRGTRARRDHGRDRGRLHRGVGQPRRAGPAADRGRARGQRRRRTHHRRAGRAEGENPR